MLAIMSAVPGVRVDQTRRRALGLDTDRDGGHERGIKLDVESRANPLHRVGDRLTLGRYLSC